MSVTGVGGVDDGAAKGHFGYHEQPDDDGADTTPGDDADREEGDDAQPLHNDVPQTSGRQHASMLEKVVHESVEAGASDVLLDGLLVEILEAERGFSERIVELIEEAAGIEKTLADPGAEQVDDDLALLLESGHELLLEAVATLQEARKKVRELSYQVRAEQAEGGEVDVRERWKQVQNIVEAANKATEELLG